MKSTAVEAKSLLADGDLVVVLTEVIVEGESYREANVYTFHDGKAIKAQSFGDTAMQERGTRTVNGKTVTKLLTPEQLSRYQPWFDNAAQLRNLVTELEALTVQAVIHAEGWAAKPRREVRKVRAGVSPLRVY